MKARAAIIHKPIPTLLENVINDIDLVCITSVNSDLKHDTIYKTLSED